MRFLIFFILLLTQSQTEKFMKGEPIVLEIEKGEEEGGAKAMILIEETPDRVFDVLCKVEDFPKFMPSVERIEVLKREGNVHTAKFYVKKSFVKFEYTIIRTCDRGNMEIRWVNADEKFKKLEGYWRFEFLGERRTKAIYYTYLKPAIFIPQFVVDYLERRSLPDMLTAVKNWIEKGERKIEKEKGEKYDF